MTEISYGQMFFAISVLWIIARALCWIKVKRIDIKREARLLFVYICFVVVARFTFFPMLRVNGALQNLVFDPALAFPFRINIIPFVNLFDYPVMSAALLNIIGNTAMFVPLGIVWPAVYRGLDSHIKVIVAGIGVSLFIEILQLPFFDRVCDIDDLILNSLGFILGYGIYLIWRKRKSTD